MTDLRAQVVEAMAAAMSPFGGKSFNMLTNPAQEQLRRQAVAALDAALDILGERREDWLYAERQAQRLAFSSGRIPPFPTEENWLASLLAVLRAGKGSDE